MAASKPSLDPLVIGIDIGGTGTKFGIVDRVGNVLFSGDISTKKHKHVETFIDELHDTLKVLIDKATGVGSGIADNGHLIYGHDGFAGELGHTIIIPDGRMHEGTGKKGSLESYASATGVRLTALEMMKQTKTKSVLRNFKPEEIDSKK